MLHVQYCSLLFFSTRFQVLIVIVTSSEMWLVGHHIIVIITKRKLFLIQVSEASDSMQIYKININILWSTSEI